jgi:hypothetical protein
MRGIKFWFLVGASALAAVCAVGPDVALRLFHDNQRRRRLAGKAAKLLTARVETPFSERELFPRHA